MCNTTGAKGRAAALETCKWATQHVYVRCELSVLLLPGLWVSSGLRIITTIWASYKSDVTAMSDKRSWLAAKRNALWRTNGCLNGAHSSAAGMVSCKVDAPGPSCRTNLGGLVGLGGGGLALGVFAIRAAAAVFATTGILGLCTGADCGCAFLAGIDFCTGCVFPDTLSGSTTVGNAVGTMWDVP
eukprot:2533457-Amphidinium_carterae.3